MPTNQSPGKQDQHIIPIVYLKQFSYNHGDTQKVCVIKAGETTFRNKSINSFLTEQNTFDLKNKDPKLQKLYEADLNGRLETIYPTILSEIAAGQISDKSEAVLKQFIANLFCRSKPQREHMASYLENQSLKKFWIGLFMHALEHDEISKELGIQWDSASLINYKRYLLNSQIDVILNEIMLLYTMLFSRLVYPLQMVILESPNEQMQWFTSDNPVITIKNLEDDPHFRILGVDSELYFPLSPQYLAYLFYAGSLVDTPHRRLKHISITKISEAEINHIIREYILPNAYEYVISPGPI